MAHFTMQEFSVKNHNSTLHHKRKLSKKKKVYSWYITAVSDFHHFYLSS